jgi:AraC-like DNA-binding protein
MTQWEKEEEEREEAQAQLDIWKYVYGFVEMAVVRCAIELGIAEAIEKHATPITLSELSSTLKCDPSYLKRIMRFLVHRKIFKITTNHDSPSYVQSALSRRLLKNGEHTMAALVMMSSSPQLIATWHGLYHRVLIDRNSAFKKAHGEDAYSYAAEHPEFNDLINEAMACDAKIVVPAVIEGCKEVFDGLNTLVDVAGGNGTTMRFLAKSCPWIKVITFDLPHVIAAAPKCEGVEYVAGDMFASVPKADAVFIKVCMGLFFF